VDGAGLHPHAPSRLYLRSDAKRVLTRQLVKPAKVPGLLPFGPLPEPVHLDAVKPTGVSRAEVDRAMNAWDQEARKEWSSLLLEPRAEAPRCFAGSRRRDRGLPNTSANVLAQPSLEARPGGWMSARR